MDNQIKPKLKSYVYSMEDFNKLKPEDFQSKEQFMAKQLTHAEELELLTPVRLCPYCHNLPTECDCYSPFWEGK